MHKSTLIGVGAALATFAASATEASASCRRGCPDAAPPVAYGYVPPAYGYAPPVTVYVVPPADFGPPGPVYGGYRPPPRVYDSYGYGPPVYDEPYRPARVWIEIR